LRPTRTMLSVMRELLESVTGVAFSGLQQAAGAVLL